jgi:hypothetical protein
MCTCLYPSIQEYSGHVVVIYLLLKKWSGEKSGSAIFRSESLGRPRGTTTTPPSCAPRAAPRSHRGSLSPPRTRATPRSRAASAPPTWPRALPNPNCRRRPPSVLRRPRRCRQPPASPAHGPIRLTQCTAGHLGVVPPRTLPIRAGGEFRWWSVAGARQREERSRWLEFGHLCPSLPLVSRPTRPPIKLVLVQHTVGVMAGLDLYIREEARARSRASSR